MKTYDNFSLVYAKTYKYVKQKRKSGIGTAPTDPDLLVH